MAGGKVKKPPMAEEAQSVHKSKELPDDLVRLSFRHYTPTEKFCLPAGEDLAAYAPVLFDRLKQVSGMRLSEFTRYNKTLRNHSHDWASTTEADGYIHLSQQLQQCTPYQFSLTANEHGRVHGILIDEVFYVVWLDPAHNLYA
jgi:hypothetical protein